MILVEKFLNMPDSYWTDQDRKYTDMTDENREKWIEDEILGRKKSLSNIKHSLRYNFDKFGVDPQENPFMKFITSMPFIFEERDEPLINILSDKQSYNALNYDNSYLKEESLYNRTPEDFQYTVNLFEIVNDPDKLRRYFSNPSDIDKSDLYDSKGRIKPVGTSETSDDTSTLFGVIEDWSENKSSSTRHSTQKMKLEQALTESGINPDNIDEVVKKDFTSASKVYKPHLKNISVRDFFYKSYPDYYAEAIQFLFQDPNELKKDGKVVFSTDDVAHIPPEYLRFGNIVEVDGTPMIYTLKEWVPLDKYKSPVLGDIEVPVTTPISIGIVASLLQLVDAIAEGTEN